MSNYEEAPNEADTEAMMEAITDAIYEMGDNTMDPGRPFDGQSHTDQGVRGKTLVEGLRYRDVADCFVLAWLTCDGRHELAESGTATYNDIFEAAPDEVDPLAVMQNMLCEMEKRQGIYPNVPDLSGMRKAWLDEHAGGDR